MKMVNVIRLLAVFCSFFVFFGSFAQDECGTDVLIGRNPLLHTQRVSCAPEVNLDTAQVLTIPLVVHVVHLGEAIGVETNISDEQILSMVDNLNHRFRGDINALTSLTDVYDEDELSLVLDSKIQFCLVSRDPDNNPTDGILRHNGSGLTYNGESYAQDGISGGGPSGEGVDQAFLKTTLGCWDTSKYFNLWIVSEINGNGGNNGTQGFSYLGPTGNNCWYGPVCLYNVVGTTGTLKAGRDLNATMTHEIGHAFGLYHTFNGGCQSTSTCTNGDFIADTPATNTNIGCTPNIDCPDAILENYMDYTSQDCKTSFTQNQIETMRDQIWNQLFGLVIDNVNCQSPNSKDIAITSVSVPSDWCLETIDFNVKINNFGGESVEGVILLVNDISYEVPTIEAGGYVLIPISNFTLGDGVIETEAIYDLDEFLDNNTLTQVVEITEQNLLEVIISPDIWSNEIDWEITDENGNILLYGGDYPFNSEEIDYYESTCLPDGCYTFRITDTNGDGMCGIDFDNDGICDITYDSFINIFVNNNLTYELSDPQEMDFGSVLEVDFCSYYCPPELCKGDFDNDGVVTIRDLLSLLAAPPGDLSECSTYDLNNDFNINVGDILDFLPLMGYNCYTGEFKNISPPEWVFDCIDNNSCFTITNVTNPPSYNGGGVISQIYYDLSGRKVNDKARLSPGIYLVVENWSNGTATTRKIFINSWE